MYVCMYVCLGIMAKPLDQKERKYQGFRVYTRKNVGATIPTPGGKKEFFLFHAKKCQKICHKFEPSGGIIQKKSPQKV